MKVLKRLGAVLCIISLLSLSLDWTAAYAEDAPPEAPHVVDASGQEVTEEQQEAAMDLLNSLENTTDYVVYAEEMSNGCNHIEGNVAVNELVKDENPAYNNNEFMIKTEMMAEGEDKISYIGQVDDGIKVTTENADDILVTQDVNAGTDVNNKGTTLLIDSIDSQVVTEALTGVVSQETAEEFVDEVQISQNLAEIKEAADAAATALSSVNGDISNEAAVSAVTNMLNANTLGKDDIIILNLTSEELQNLSSAQDEGGVPTLTARLRQLLDANQTSLATVIINVTTNNEPNITIAQGIRSSDQNRNGESNGYLIWNFGSYDGTITFNGVMSGVTVAPNATVISNDTYEGRIIAQVYKHNGSETHTPNKYDKDYPEVKPPTDNPPKEDPPKDDPPKKEDPPKDDPKPNVPSNPPKDPPSPPGKTDPKPGPGPSPKPNTPPTTTVEIKDDPIPLSPVGMENETTSGNLPTVLGVNRNKGQEQGVLGERRQGPETGDSSDCIFWLVLLCISICMMVVIPKYSERRQRYEAAAAKVFY